MAMTIEKSLEWLISRKEHYEMDDNCQELAQALDFAIDTMHKYQKIQKILNSASYVENGTVYSYTYDEDSRIKHIREVLEDGKID